MTAEDAPLEPLKSSEYFWLLDAWRSNFGPHPFFVLLNRRCPSGIQIWTRNLSRCARDLGRSARVRAVYVLPSVLSAL
eukprot:1017174-Rhodomonas_salina.2